eukprot:PITA_29593
MMNVVEPSSYKEANESNEWKIAMEQEYDSIIRNNTWELVELPRGKQVIGFKWLYKPKINTDGTIEKLKSRLVAKGYTQKKGIDYEETFTPVAKLNTIRMLIALATKKHWIMQQLDVKSTFLNGELKEEVYLEQPEGFFQKGIEHLVCRLKKALYGLKQAPRSWYEKIYSFFLQAGYNRSDAIYLIDEIKQQISQMFEMKHLDELRYCLGLEIWRDSGQTFISQAKYVKVLLEKFRMDQCKYAPVALQQTIKLQCQDGSKTADATLYRQLVGSLIYLTTSRPDLAYAVSVLSQFMSTPLESHWNAAKNVLRYLQGTVDYGIIYTDSSDVILARFSDSDWAGNVDDHRSITGYAFILGSGVITWSSKKAEHILLVLSRSRV